MKKILLILSAMMLFTGCGSNDEEKKNIDVNKTEESNVTTPDTSSVDYTIPLKYNYNKDGSSNRRLAPIYVNQHKEIQKKLDEKKSDSVEFYSILSGYIGDLYRNTESFNMLPVYAPSGESKSQMVTVTNGQVDYSSYKLKGDVDFNGEVDFTDLKLLSEAILNDIDSFQYDVNGDGKIDTADIIDLIARFGNEIRYFDFYTKNGKKLSIDTRTIDEEKHFTYNGSETQIMVVAKDRNHASAYERGLSDIDDVWYKKDGWSLEQTLPPLNKNKLSKSNSELFKNRVNNWTFYDLGKISVGEYLKNHPYLVGWKFGLSAQLSSYNGGVSNSKNLMPRVDEEPLKSYLKLMETEIMKYFSTTDMGYPPKVQKDKWEYLYTVGALIDKNYHQMQGLYLDAVYKNSITEETINIRHFYLWDMTLYYSPESYMLVGELTRSNEQEIKGKVTAGRIGPDKQAVYESEILDDSFEVSPVPFGTYALTYEDECTCISTLDENYVFEVEGEIPKFNIKDNKVKVKLQLLDKESEPIGNKVIKIVAKSCVASNDDEKSFSSSTDDKGYIDFNNVPIGDYIVYADGKENSEIHFCEAYDGKIFDEKLWNIDVSFKGRSLSQEWHWRNIKIAGINEPLKTEYDSEYPFPYMHDHGGMTLVDTSFYDNADSGLILAYYAEAYPSSGPALIQKGYCVDTDWLKELITDDGDTHIDCTGKKYIPTWDGIQTSLNLAQETAYTHHKRFTIQDTGRWINDQGSSSLTITFSPSK